MQMFIQKVSIAVGSVLLPFVSLADEGHEEEGEFAHQMGEILPFEHIGEGHWIAFVVLTILWISLIYNVYTYLKRRGQKGSQGGI